MDDQSPDLSAKQSLDLIASMIMEAKGNVQRNNFYFLLWGWVVVSANLGMYALWMIDYKHPYVVWTITIPAWIYTIYRSFRDSRTKYITTHFDHISGWLWVTYGVTILILVAFGYKVNFQLNPLILAVTAVPTLVSGVILKFRPLIWGGIAFWVGAIVCFLVTMKVQPLVGAVTIIFGYLIPGYRLRRMNVE
ncbi:MAG TPA: hypothetical protein VEB86_12945 [Chryseosolibacter sp.]|nr:hypothetical protein [Chryseosolibacter sp.]